MIEHCYTVRCDRSPTGPESSWENPVCHAMGGDTIERACECARANGWLVEEGIQLCKRHREVER